MPTYEFRCPKGHEFEKFYRSIGTAPTEVHCPECGALAERLLSGGAGLVFKGSGFYITDYGKDGKKDQRKSPVKTESGSSEKTETASKPAESAPAASSDAKSSSRETKPAAPAAPAASAPPKSSKKKDSK